MELRQLIENTPVRLAAGSGGMPIAGITDDSRAVMPGYLFVARPGTQTDGAKFIPAAIKNGAAAVLTHTPLPWTHTVPLLLAEDVGLAAIELARKFHDDPASKLHLLAITGTNGKTTTTYMLRHLLGAVGKKCGVIGTVEIDTGRGARPAELTTPGALELIAIFAEMVRNGCEACAMEVSSHALHQGRVRGLRFDVASFTNLTGDHLDYHATMDAYADAKAILFESLDARAWAVVNGDDPYVRRMLRDCRAKPLTYGENPDSDCHTRVLSADARGSDCLFDGPWGSLRVKLPLIGKHNVANMTGALGCLRAMGVDVMRLAQAIEQCPAVPGRLERVITAGNPRDFDVFVDYAHTDDALSNVLHSLRPLTRGKLRVMFGCGGDRDATKRPRMAKTACELADAVVVTSDNPRTEDPMKIIGNILAGVDAGASRRVAVVPDRAEAIGRIIRDASAGDVVLLAGKGHEDYQIIGKEKHPFDDRLIAARELEELKWVSGPVTISVT